MKLNSNLPNPELLRRAAEGLFECLEVHPLTGSCCLAIYTATAEVDSGAAARLRSDPRFTEEGRLFEDLFHEDADRYWDTLKGDPCRAWWFGPIENNEARLLGLLLAAEVAEDLHNPDRHGKPAKRCVRRTTRVPRRTCGTCMTRSEIRAHAEAQRKQWKEAFEASR